MRIPDTDDVETGLLPIYVSYTCNCTYIYVFLYAWKWKQSEKGNIFQYKNNVICIIVLRSRDSLLFKAKKGSSM